MNELLNSIDMNGAGILFVRIILLLVAVVTGVIGLVAISIEFDPDEDYEGMLKFGLILILICIGAFAILLGCLP